MTFRRGIKISHLAPSRFQAADEGEELTAPELTLKLDEQPGLKYLPQVTTGDTVSKYQPVAAPDSVKAAYLHAPAGGLVISANRKEIVISVGEKQEEAERVNDIRLPGTQQELVNLLRKMGVRGLGGGGFPAHAKLDYPIDTLIINAVECEPGLACDKEILNSPEKMERVIQATALLGKILGLETGFLALKSHSGVSRFGDSLRDSTRNLPWLELKYLPDIYPAGAEAWLIWHLTQMRIDGNTPPSALGIVCLNLGTLLSVYEAVYDQRPQTSRLLTLWDRDQSLLINRRVSFGTPVSFVLRTLGYDTGRLAVKTGGLLYGDWTNPGRHYVSPSTNGIYIQSTQSTSAEDSETACISCGRCADHCCVDLLPQQLLRYSGHTEKLTALRLNDCIACGACDLVCPSRIPITKRLSQFKRDLQFNRVQQAKAEIARQQFERHLQREKNNWESEQERLKTERKASGKAELINAALKRKTASANRQEDDHAD